MLPTAAEKKKTFEILDQYQGQPKGIAVLINKIEYGITEKQYRGSCRLDRSFTEKHNGLTWTDEDPDQSEKDSADMTEIFADASRVLNAWGIRHTIDQFEREYFREEDRRGFEISKVLTFEVSEDKADDIMTLIREYRLYDLRQKSGGWMDRVEQSVFVRYLADSIFDAYIANAKDPHHPASNENILPFKVRNSRVCLEYAGGKKLFRNYVFQEFGWKDLITEEQKTGFAGALLKLLAGIFTDYGIKYVTFVTDRKKDISCTAVLHPSFEESRPVLKDW